MLKMICPHCQGNGFIKVTIDEGRTEEVDCEMCSNQGEVEITEPNLDELNKMGRLQWSGLL